MTCEPRVRPARADDRRDILRLLERALGWTNDPRHEALFAWKHDQNVFGSSPAWVAWHGDCLVGFRTFLRWEFELSGQTIRAVRAVDTATDPEHQRRGVFRRLTFHALEDLQGGDAEFVFNTPNNRSRPGYISMGWQGVGRIPLAARPGGAGGMFRMAGARVPADLWSAETAAGEPAAAVLDDVNAISGLLASQPRSQAMTTRRSPDYLRWRYGFPHLNYRAVVVGGDPARGLAIFRVRRRGTAHETALCDLFMPEADAGTGRQLVREVARTVGSDYLVRVAAPRDACVPLPRQGPVLISRPLRDIAPRSRDHWNLTLGDVELF